MAEQDPEVNEPLQGQNGMTITEAPGKDKQGFKEKVRTIAVENPPSKAPLAFLGAFCGLLCCLPAATCACCCCLFGILYQFVPLAEIIVGALWYNEENCPEEPRIPLLLIIGGSIGILAGAVESAYGRKKIQDQGKSQKGKGEGDAESPDEPAKETKDVPFCVTLLANLLRLASIVWVVYSAIVVYRFFDEVTYDEGDQHYCHPALYRLLFWVVTISIAALVIAPVIICCVMCFGVAVAGAAVAAS